jgi:hypothetical protein
MRKIYLNTRIQDAEPVINMDYFQKDNVIIKNTDGTVENYRIEKHKWEGKRYTLAEVIAIDQCNKILDTPMTDEETEYMLTTGLGRPERLDPETTAARAGYRVEKKIIPL